ncbi:MAG: thioredoxin domain-containing protein [Candidatus Ozemobacteraceae bacterium]
MKTSIRIFAILLVVAALLSGHFPGSESRCSCSGNAACAQTPDVASASVAAGVQTATASAPASIAATIADQTASPASSKIAQSPLPRLIDLGAKKCISCKKMAPILDDAKKLYSGIADVEFIDVWENRDANMKYGLRTIPTQIFFDAAGKEVFRHEGFFPMEDIQKQFETMGVVLKKQ